VSTAPLTAIRKCRPTSKLKRRPSAATICTSASFPFPCLKISRSARPSMGRVRSEDSVSEVTLQTTFEGGSKRPTS
jgi:hypothetical protein